MHGGGRNKRGPNSASLLGLVNNRKTGRGFAVGSEVGFYAFRDMSQDVTGNSPTRPCFLKTCPNSTNRIA